MSAISASSEGHRLQSNIVFAAIVEGGLLVWCNEDPNFSPGLLKGHDADLSKRPGQLVMLCDRARIVARSDCPETMP
jgi:hypothetical protein